MSQRLPLTAEMSTLISQLLAAEKEEARRFLLENIDRIIDPMFALISERMSNRLNENQNLGGSDGIVIGQINPLNQIESTNPQMNHSTTDNDAQHDEGLSEVKVEPIDETTTTSTIPSSQTLITEMPFTTQNEPTYLNLPVPNDESPIPIVHPIDEPSMPNSAAYIDPANDQIHHSAAINVPPSTSKFANTVGYNPHSNQPHSKIDEMEKDNNPELYAKVKEEVTDDEFEVTLKNNQENPFESNLIEVNENEFNGNDTDTNNESDSDSDSDSDNDNDNDNETQQDWEYWKIKTEPSDDETTNKPIASFQTANLGTSLTNGSTTSNEQSNHNLTNWEHDEANQVNQNTQQQENEFDQVESTNAESDEPASLNPQQSTIYPHSDQLCMTNEQNIATQVNKDKFDENDVGGSMGDNVDNPIPQNNLHSNDNNMSHHIDLAHNHNRAKFENRAILDDQQPNVQVQNVNRNDTHQYDGEFDIKSVFYDSTINLLINSNQTTDLDKCSGIDCLLLKGILCTKCRQLLMMANQNPNYMVDSSNTEFQENGNNSTNEPSTSCPKPNLNTSLTNVSISTNEQMIHNLTNWQNEEDDQVNQIILINSSLTPDPDTCQGLTCFDLEGNPCTHCRHEMMKINEIDNYLMDSDNTEYKEKPSEDEITNEPSATYKTPNTEISLTRESKTSNEQSNHNLTNWEHDEAEQVNQNSEQQANEFDQVESINVESDELASLIPQKSTIYLYSDQLCMANEQKIATQVNEDENDCRGAIGEQEKLSDDETTNKPIASYQTANPKTLLTSESKTSNEQSNHNLTNWEHDEAEQGNQNTVQQANEFDQVESTNAESDEPASLIPQQQKEVGEDGKTDKLPVDQQVGGEESRSVENPNEPNHPGTSGQSHSETRQSGRIRKPKRFHDELSLNNRDNREVDSGQEEQEAGPSRPVKRYRKSKTTTSKRSKQTKVITLTIQCPVEGCKNEPNGPPSMFPKNQINIHLKNEHPIGQISCYVKSCGRTFIDTDKLGVHVKRQHANQKWLKCNECHKDFSKPYTLTIHYKMNHQLGEYMCSFTDCTFRGDVQKDVSDHYIHVHVPRIKCRFNGCNFKSNSPSGLKSHEKAHLSQYRYSCGWPECDIPGTNEMDIINHIQAKHLVNEHSHLDPCNYIKRMHHL